MSLLSPPQSIGVALGTSALVYAIFSKTLPTIADMRVADSQNRDLKAAERQATFTSIGVVSAISLLAKDPTIFTIGGLTTLILAWSHKHADMVSPITGKAAQDLRVPELVPETQAATPQQYGYAGDAVTGM